MVYPRKVYPALLAHAQTPLVTVLTGMRRTGKTTLVNQLLLDLPNKNSLFLDLQRQDIRDLFAQKNYDAIRDAFIGRGLTTDKPMVVALDEIQLAPEVSGVIKYLLDHFQIKFIVTGSSSYYLKHLFTESLAGRKKVFELFPLDFGEFLDFKEITHRHQNWQAVNFNVDDYQRLSSYYEEFIRFGGFPQVVLAQTETEKRDLIQDILSSFINIDVKTLADFADERNLYNLIKLLAKRVSNRIGITTLARTAGISRPTVTNYLTFLEKTYLIATVPVYTKSIDREIVKAKKLYFVDSGMANTLADLGSGVQFENTLYNQLARQHTVQYYALKSGQEIDFVIDGHIGVEAKETPIKTDLNPLDRLAKTAGLSEHLLVGRYVSPSFNRFVWAGSIT